MHIHSLGWASRARFLALPTAFSVQQSWRFARLGQHAAMYAENAPFHGLNSLREPHRQETTDEGEGLGQDPSVSGGEQPGAGR